MKLLICDDDISTIDFIQNSLNCNEFGITKILRAYNGLTAKDMIAAERPELILCDIGMPQCNGIEVLKYVSKTGYGPEFAFLTCYESFEYAREAMRYGATNYLTKPINLNELREALVQMIATLRGKQLAQGASENSIHHADLLLNNFLQRLRDGIYGEEKAKITAAMERRNLSLQADSSVRCVLVSADSTNALKNGWNKELLVYSFNYLSQEIVAERQDFAYSIVDMGERFITITMLLRAQRAAEQEVVRRCDHLISACRSYLLLQPVCLVGEVLPLWQLPKVGPELQRRLHKIRLQNGQVRLFREDAAPVGSTAPALDETKILDCIKRRDKTGYVTEISAIANKISVDKSGSDCAIALLHHDLIRAFNDYLHDNAIPAHALFQDEMIRALDGTAERSVFDMMNFAVHLYDYTVMHLLELSDSENVISKVKRYITIHYRENIDRDSVAAIAFVTPNYLSKRFRSEVGMNMREYINQLRVKEAKRLLLSTDFSISKIASDIGFDNISYFSTVFRKQCGMSPADWRNRKGCGDIDETETTIAQR